MPDDKTRRQIQMMVIAGVTVDDIAKILEIGKTTLWKYYKSDLETAKQRANAAVAASLYKQAVNGNTTAQIFWLKTQAQWRDVTTHEVEVRGIVSDKPLSVEAFAKKYEGIIDAEDYLAATARTTEDTD